MMHSSRTPSPRKTRCRAATLAALCCVLLAVLTNPLQAETELRLLIDVSGSMRENDPRNLRVPALRLVNELLPVGSEVGVWLFAERTEVLAPPGTVDDAWKRKIRARLGRIHSRGLLTDIEQAIQTATADWDAPATDQVQRHLVLLTDGLVDVSKDPDESAASRERIASQQLARLQSLRVKVNVIALSDEVDSALMHLLSTQTGGWLETPRDAETLQRIFLHMLEQTAAPTTVPLTDNRFEIDEQVSEFTLLAFRAEGGETRLIGPDDQRISVEQLPKDAAWRAEGGYDLVTLTRPKPGVWRLEGVEDPDNRVVVVTDLDIASAPLTNVLRAGETPTLEVWLTDHQQPVIREDLLDLLTATATLSGAAETPQKTSATSTGAEDTAQPLIEQPQTFAMTLDAQSGRFTTTLDTQALEPGIYTLRRLINGGTFQRQRITRIKIAGPPISVVFDQQYPSEADPAAAIRLTLKSEPDLIDPASLRGYFLVEGPAGWNSAVEIPSSVRLPMGIRIPIERPGDYRLKGRLLARTQSDESIEILPEPRVLTFDFASSDMDEPDAREETTPDIAWLTLSGYVLGGNALLGALLGLTWWGLKRPKSAPKKGGKMWGRP